MMMIMIIGIQCIIQLDILVRRGGEGLIDKRAACSSDFDLKS